MTEKTQNIQDRREVYFIQDEQTTPTTPTTQNTQDTPKLPISPLFDRYIYRDGKRGLRKRAIDTMIRHILLQALEIIDQYNYESRNYTDDTLTTYISDDLKEIFNQIHVLTKYYYTANNPADAIEYLLEKQDNTATPQTAPKTVQDESFNTTRDRNADLLKSLVEYMSKITDIISVIDLPFNPEYSEFTDCIQYANQFLQEYLSYIKGEDA